MNEIKKYEDCFAFVSEKIYKARIRTHLSVNNELLKLYWEIGNTVLDVQNRLGWGSKFIDRLSKDIKRKYPDISGFSIRNLKYMRAFADAYPDFPFVQVPLAQNENKGNKLNSISKCNFYISAEDDKLAGKNDNQSIGLLLCASKNNVKVEYAMRGFDKPIGIAAYELEEFIKKSVPEFND